MNNLYLFARVADTGVAVRASEVEAVVKLSGLSTIPGVPGHVAGLATLRSRVLTIIDIAALISGKCDPAEVRSYAIVSEICGHSYGLLVDQVIDICEVTEEILHLRGRIDPAWQRYAEGVKMREGEPHLLVSLGSFIEINMFVQAA